MFWSKLLNKYISKHKLSQGALSRLLGVNPSTVSLWITGNRKFPKENEHFKEYIKIMFPDIEEQKKAVLFVYFGE